jgi:mono/diheme cytochrome c family protein
MRGATNARVPSDGDEMEDMGSISRRSLFSMIGAVAGASVYVVVKGRKDMPPLASYLSNAQIARVVTYVRTHFGNHYADAVSPEMVKAAREAH